MNSFTTGLLQILRPANIITSMSNSIAGFAASTIGMGTTLFASDYFNWTSALLLIIASAFLYAGGIVFNDYFDAELDAKERPERPIPSGKLTRRFAGLLGSVCFVIAIALTYNLSPLSSTIASAISVSCIIYNAKAKHHVIVGPFFMGLCRGFNFLLGVSINPEFSSIAIGIACIYVLYIGTVTLISQEEVHASNPIKLKVAFFLYMIIITIMFTLGGFTHFHLLSALPFILYFSFNVYRPLIKAIKDPIPPNIGKSVKFGVLSIVIFDAAIAAGFIHFFGGLFVLLFLALSMIVAKKFAVT